MHLAIFYIRFKMRKKSKNHRFFLLKTTGAQRAATQLVY